MDLVMIKAIRGTKDILPGEAARWQAIEKRARDFFRLYGYREFRTPIIEETGLFVKSVGEETDIVKKEMFSFVDRGDRNISLRPEGTAPIVRAYIEHGFDKRDPFQKFYYIGPMFRAERPQAGRLRQFHQVGVEALGSYSPMLDAEVMMLMCAFIDAAGIKDYTLKLNNLGCRDDKGRLSKVLKDIFTSPDVGALLCDDCKRRASTNPLRVLDCKNEACRRLVRERFSKIDFLCKECRDHFEAVLRFLKDAGIKYEIDPFIVRGLDYYTKTVFEAVSGQLGAQNAIGAGGRYDKLVGDMGGAEVGACGFAVGIDRMLLALYGDEPAEEKDDAVSVYVAAIGAGSYAKAFGITNALRIAGVASDIDFESKSLKAQMRLADKLGVRYVLILGEDEINKGEALLRNMATKEQVAVKLENCVTEIAKIVAGK